MRLTVLNIGTALLKIVGRIKIALSQYPHYLIWKIGLISSVCMQQTRNVSADPLKPGCAFAHRFKGKSDTSLALGLL